MQIKVKVVVAGGGWAGCAAAYMACKRGAQVTLLEKTDLLLGTGLVGGIMANNGRFTAAGELKAMGVQEFFNYIDAVTRHRGLDFPGHRHADLYDVRKIERSIRKVLKEAGVDVKLYSLVTSVDITNGVIKRVRTKKGAIVEGDIFIDATGTAGPATNCTRYGAGCAMCILRCPTFGPRISLTSLAGIGEIVPRQSNPDFDAISGSCKIVKDSLRADLREKLSNEGKLIVPLPALMVNGKKLTLKACQQYALPEYAENLVLLDTGHAKLMAPFFSLEHLRDIPGFEDARFADPYSGGQGNSVRFNAMARCSKSLRVHGMRNLLCAGEKAGLLVGHTEAIATGLLAGYNAVALGLGKKLLVYPGELAVGDLLDYMHKEMETVEGMKKKYTFSGSIYFERMLENGLYTTDKELIARRVDEAGMTGIFNRPWE